jgi:hypothetical protein
LSPKEEGRRNPSNKPAIKGKSLGTRKSIKSRKACKSGGGRKTPHERGKDPPPT